MDISKKLITSFYALQNEGLTIGTPCFHLYFAGCNLSCKYCDAKSASRPNLKALQDFDVTKLNIPSNCDRILFTGGEPTLQPLEEIIKSIENHYERNFIYELDTNGTNKVSDDLLVKINMFNLNFKLSGTQEIEQLEDYRLIGLRWWLQKKKITTFLIVRFKFVVDNENQFKEVLELIDKYEIPKNLVIIIRQGITIESFIKNPFNSKLIDLCKQHGLAYSPRLHIFKLGAV